MQERTWRPSWHGRHQAVTGDAATDGPVSIAVVPDDMPLRDRLWADCPCSSMFIGALLSSAMLGSPEPGVVLGNAAMQCDYQQHTGRDPVCRSSVGRVQAFEVASCSGVDVNRVSTTQESRVWQGYWRGTPEGMPGATTAMFYLWLECGVSHSFCSVLPATFSVGQRTDHSSDAACPSRSALKRFNLLTLPSPTCSGRVHGVV